MKARTGWFVLAMSVVALTSGCGPHEVSPVPAPEATVAPPPATIVAIIVRPMQETDDKVDDALANQQAINDMVAEAIELTGGLADLVKPGQTVLLKPNLTNHRGGRYFPSMTTDVRVMSAVVDALKNNGDNKLIFAEGSGPPAMEMFKICAYDKLAELHGIELIELNTPSYFRDVTIRREVFAEKPLPPALPVATGEHVMKTYPLPAPYMDADVVINVPCLKTHALTGITVSMKNLYGLFPGDRQEWHDDVEANLADLARVRKTALVVVDGIVAMEGEGPLWGTPVKMNLIIAGRDMVAVDAVSAAVMGYDPRRVLHAQLAALQGGGVADLDKIVIKGTPIADAKRATPFADGHWWFSLKCPLTDANIAKLLERPNKRVIGGWTEEERGKVIGWEIYFDPWDLPLDAEKHPDVQPRGFTAAFNKFDESIHFNGSYRALHREEIEPMRQALQAWIDANMETEKPETQPTTFPNIGEDARAVTRAMREQQQREQQEQREREQKEREEREQREREQQEQQQEQPQQ